MAECLGRVFKMTARKKNITATFKPFNLSKLDKEERSYIKENDYYVFIIPEAFNKNNFCGFAVNDEIEFETPKLNRSKVILLQNGHTKKETRLTFWHEVGHFLLRSSGHESKLTKKEKELICEGYAVLKLEDIKQKRLIKLKRKGKKKK